MHHRRPRIAASLALGVLLLGTGSCANDERGSAVNETSRPDNYQPRFVSADGEHAHTNRLIDETSPYLLQHAHNPVDWYPWGPEAFAAAREQDKPIFLSVGYSTCYWCHVMERESFENESVAELMNEYFICIKVDREERPDIDDIYMTAVRLFSQGQGGWPMSVFLEPVQLKPFFGGTYFPPADSGGRPGFATLLTRVAEIWSESRDGLLAQADQAAEAITAELRQSATPVGLDASVASTAVTQLMSVYDAELGGFGQAPKFPQSDRVQLLINAAWDDSTVRAACLHTLDAMAMGGMYDQVGGGFHRYSTDAKWLVPHFEKMLYDNGLLASTYAEAFERTKDPWYAEILRETLDYALREMTGSSGRFFSAQDAEVDSREGASYVWTPAQLADAAGEHHGLALGLYGFDAGPNFQDPHHPDEPPTNILFLTDKPAALAAERDMSVEEFDARVRELNASLLQVRNTRKQPITDDKTLVGWNGLMISGMADGGRVLGETRYLEASARAADFILGNMMTSEGLLLRSYRGEEARIPAFLEDYAFMIGGLLALHRAAEEDRWLAAARDLMDTARQNFWDGEQGGYFDTLAGQGDLFVRAKARYDGATPSGNSQMLVNLLDMHEATGENRYLSDASATLAAMSQALRQSPTSAVVATMALERMLRDYPEYVPEGNDPGNATTPVRTTVTPQVVDLSQEPVTITVRLEISDGFHVNAHEPGDPGLRGLELRLVGEGVELKVEYPAGEPFTAPIFDNEIRVHSGITEIPVQVSRVGPLKERLRILLSYQVCNDQVCLAPVDEVLPVIFEADAND